VYVKLFSDILQSSIWAEDPETCKVWITLLALADRHGLVRATAPGVANAARVELDKTRQALELFEAPDPDSRTPDNEGRRIKRVDGGYVILNYTKYRELYSEEMRREQSRVRSQNFRNRHAPSRKITQNHDKQKHTPETLEGSPPDSPLPGAENPTAVTEAR